MSALRLWDKIAAAELDITLSQADRDAITALRAEVTAMEEKAQPFTADELAVLTKAETDMAALLPAAKAATPPWPSSRPVTRFFTPKATSWRKWRRK